MKRFYQHPGAYALILIILGSPFAAHYWLHLWWVGGMVSLVAVAALLIWMLADAIAFRDIE